VDHHRAFVACCEADPRCEPHKESYLSAFQFGDDFAKHLKSTGSTKGFTGACWTDWVWFDIDREGDLKAAVDGTRRLVVAVVDRLGVAESDVLVFFSGGKGFHCGLPTLLWTPEPGRDFHKITRRFCETIAEQAEVVIDSGVYDRVRCFRAPNSKHPKTGLHKRRLTVDQLAGWSLDAILEHAKTPTPFEPPEPTGKSEAAAAVWVERAEQVRRETEANAARRANANGDDAKLNRLTLACISDGVPSPRHKTLFSASANLAEFGAPLGLCRALLEESGLDSGLMRHDVKRTICCGWASVQPAVKKVCDAVGGTVVDVATAKPDAEPKAVPHE